MEINIIGLIIGVIFTMLGYRTVSRFRRSDKQILGITILILGVLLILFSIGFIKLSWLT